MAVAVPWLTLAAAAYSGYTQYQAGRYQAEVAKKNQQLGREAASDAILRGQVEEDVTRQKGFRLKGAQRAAFGASGVDVATGSPLDVLADTAGLSELDAVTIRNNAAREAWGYENQAMNLRLRGDLEAEAALGAGVGTALGGTAEALYQYKQLHPTK